MPATGPIDRQQIGRAAEDAATRYLQERQLTILMRNYRCRSGEIDVVAETMTGVIVIVEVRLRATDRYGGGAASVDWRKQRRIQRAACHLLMRHPALASRAVRFDVLNLVPDGPSGYQFNWIPQAFEASPR